MLFQVLQQYIFHLDVLYCCFMIILGGIYICNSGQRMSQRNLISYIFIRDRFHWTWWVYSEINGIGLQLWKVFLYFQRYWFSHLLIWTCKHFSWCRSAQTFDALCLMQFCILKSTHPFMIFIQKPIVWNRITAVSFVI